MTDPEGKYGSGNPKQEKGEGRSGSSGDDSASRPQEVVVTHKKRGGKKGLIAFLVAALAGVGVWRAMECGGFGLGGSGGKGTADRSSQTTKARKDDALKKRPMTVTIEGDRYLVDGVAQPLDSIANMAASVPEGQGPAVIVLRKGTSTARAEQNLAKALRTRKIDFVMRDEK